MCSVSFFTLEIAHVKNVSISGITIELSAKTTDSNATTEAIEIEDPIRRVQINIALISTHKLLLLMQLQRWY